MPVDEGIETDLRFLIVEIKKQSKLAQESLLEQKQTELQKAHLHKMGERDDVIASLKNTIEHKAYFYLHQSHQHVKLNSSRLKALITIASSLRKMGEFFLQVCRQLEYIQQYHHLKSVDWRKFFKVIEKMLDLIIKAHNHPESKHAQKLCEGEQRIDDLYLEYFQKLMTELQNRKDIPDRITLIFILRYLERIGDAFLEIGEAILNIKVGEQMHLRTFQSLEKGLKKVGIKLSAEELDYRPIMNTRSGCKIAKISSKPKGEDLSDKKEEHHPQKQPKESKARKKKSPTESVHHTVFYKEGIKHKIKEEKKGLVLWEKYFPGHVPKLLWDNTRKKHATLLMEYIEGRDLLDLMVNVEQGHQISPSQAQQQLWQLLEQLWSKTKRKAKPVDRRLAYLNQLLRRKSDIEEVHQRLFDKKTEIEFDLLLPKIKRIEKKIKAPFHVLSHGDFNVDNIVFDIKQQHPCFVDVHRSGFNDYVQDVSVFLVSNFRVPIFSEGVRSRLNDCSLEMYYFSKKFAEENHDHSFDLRLAFGLLRSFMTSTRFQFDERFSSLMFHRSMDLMYRIIEYKKHLKEFRLEEDCFLYGSH
jgi:phosphate uptake regulator/aminoglycoside phosphotransferase